MALDRGDSPFKDSLFQTLRTKRFRRAIFLGLIGATVVSGITMVSTLTTIDLGSVFLRSDNRSFDQVTLTEPGVVIGNQLVELAGVNSAASGNTSPGVEASSALPSINTALVTSNYSYKFEVKEAEANSFQAGDNQKIEVFKDAALIATLYLKQDVVDDANVEGVTVEVDMGATSSGVMTTTVTPVLSNTLAQQDYRWYTNADSVTPGTALAIENAIYNNAVDGTPYHLRMSIEPTTVNEPAGRRFKLQYSTFTSGPWTDLGTPGSTEVWRGYDNSTVIDGAALPSVLLSNSFNNSRQTYEETNNATTQTAIAKNKLGEFAWVVQPNSPLPATTYYFRMAGAHGASLDTYTNYPQVQIAGPDLPPAAPTGLVATAGDGVVSLNWNDNGEPDLAGYNVYRSTNLGGPYTKINGSLALTSDYSDTAVTNGTTYYYVVTAEDSAVNESGNSSEVSATPTSQPPEAPTGLMAAAGYARVSLNWNDNGEIDLAGYNVYRSTTMGGPYTKLNGTLVAISSYMDVAVTNGITYYYVVTAEDNTANESGNSSEVSATPNTIRDDFESGGFVGGRNWLDNWTIVGPATVTTANSPYAATYHLNVDTGSDVMRSADLSGLSSMRLQFWAKVNSHSGNRKSYAEVSSDGTNWTVVATWDRNSTTLVYSFFDVDLTPYTMSSQFWVRFRTDSGGSSTMWVDNVEITQ